MGASKLLGFRMQQGICDTGNGRGTLPPWRYSTPLGHASSAPAVVSRRLGSLVSVLPSSLGHPLVTRVWVSSSRVRIYYNDYNLGLVPLISYAHEFISVCACNVR